MPEPQKKADKSTRGNASQFFIAGELCRRGYVALVTIGNTPNTDILCSNIAGSKFVHIQVKTFVPGGRTVSVGKKAERFFGDNFIWILGGIPHPESNDDFEYYIIPSKVVSDKVSKEYKHWLEGKGKLGQSRNDNDIRTILLPPHKSPLGWSIEKYKNNWAILDELLK